jgi:acetylornithine deacetylase
VKRIVGAEGMAPAGVAFGRDELLALHREIVATPSVSGEEGALADLLAARLAAHGVRAERHGSSLLAIAGEGPVLLLDTHLDTVPPAPGWRRDPFAASVEGGRVYGLGSNDAKAAVAAMTAAFVALAGEPLPFALGLALVEGEETRGTGTQRVLAELAARGRPLLGAVIGEPTGLDVAIAQKGLLLLELVARGDSCHAAHAAALGARNAALLLARDLVTLADAELAPPHALLGPTTLQPTVVRAGETRNVVPGEARAVLDVRTTPEASHAELTARVRGLVASEVEVRSERLVPRQTDESSWLVRAALAARPAARAYGSPTLSDMVYVDGVPAIKVGPGASERSHTADEWVGEEEVVAGAAFYVELVRRCARVFTETPARARASAAATQGPAR